MIDQRRFRRSEVHGWVRLESLYRFPVSQAVGPLLFDLDVSTPTRLAMTSDWKVVRSMDVQLRFLGKNVMNRLSCSI